MLLPIDTAVRMKSLAILLTKVCIVIIMMSRVVTIIPAAIDDNYLQSIHYESLDNLYDKTPPPNNKVQPLSNKLNTSLEGDNEELPAEEEYMKMAPSRSCSHATIKSETLRSCDVKLNQMDFGCQDNQQTTNLHYNSLPNHYSHYDIPPNNSCHSNGDYYDTPRSHKLASTK